MAVESDNVERLMGWLADDGPARSAHPSAETLVEKLAVLVFQGEGGWPRHTGHVDLYSEALRGWFANDDGGAARFAALTGPGSDPSAFVDWFLPVVLGWEQWAAGHESGTAAADGTATAGGTAAGLSNPNCDGTPGTEFYRFDAARGEYLYAAAADAEHWLTYEQRRYAEPVRDANYGLDYRYDHTTGAYEWRDEASGSWRDQAWADQYAASRPGVAAQVGDIAEALLAEHPHLKKALSEEAVEAIVAEVAREMTEGAAEGAGR